MFNFWIMSHQAIYIFFQIPFMFINSFWKITRYLNHIFFITILTMDIVNFSLRFDVSIAIFILDFFFRKMSVLIRTLIFSIMFVAKLLGKIIYLCNKLSFEKLFVRNLWKTFTFVNFESFYFSMLYKRFRILKFYEGIFYKVKFII